jgi:hypothetical protein
MTLMNAVGFTRVALADTAVPAAPAAASTTAPSAHALLLQDIKTLQTGIDSGKVTSQAAIDAFAQSIQAQDVSIDEVNAFVKTQVTPEQFATFQDKVSTSLRGIDPTTLTSEETGEIVGQALAQMHTEGLYWNGCVNVWTGAALIAAAVIVGVVAIVKGRSVAAVQKDYANKISNSNNSYNTSISNAQNWKTAYPQIISQDQAQIGQDQSDINFANYELQFGDLTSAQAQFYSEEITERNNDIYANESSISYYSTEMGIYANNPGQVSVDVANWNQERDSAQSTLENEEVAAVAAVPANQKLAVGLGIGAGVGAAIGAGLLSWGLVDKGCQ